MDKKPCLLPFFILAIWNLIKELLQISQSQYDGPENIINNRLIPYEIVKASIGNSHWELSHAFVSILW
jgi:hypothetical protein